MIQVKKITLTPANIYALFATPQIALAAPASGYVNNILGISHDIVYVSSAYTVAGSIWYGLTNGGNIKIFEDTWSLTATASNNRPVNKKVAGQSIFSTTKDFYMTTDAAAATGNSPIDAYIVYETKVLS